MNSTPFPNENIRTMMSRDTRQSLPTPTSRVVMVDIFDAPLFVVIVVIVVIVDSVVIMAYHTLIFSVMGWSTSQRQLCIMHYALIMHY